MDQLKITTCCYETRTPVTNIIGFTELIEKVGKLNPKQREYLGDVLASAKTLLSIIDDLLEAANADTEGGPTLH